MLSNVTSTLLLNVFTANNESVLTTLPPSHEGKDPIEAEAANSESVLTTLPPSHEGIDPIEAEAGAIAGVVFGVVVSAVFIAVAGFLYVRRKRARDREYMRRSEIHRRSKQSAGVYTDTTVDSKYIPSEEASGDYRSLRKDPNVYESDSEDEL